MHLHKIWKHIIGYRPKESYTVQEALTGTDLITGNKLTGTERVITAGAIFIPVVSGKSINSTGKVVKAATKEPTQKAIKSGARKLGKKTDEFVDGAKKAGDKIVKGLDDAGEKINKTCIQVNYQEYDIKPYVRGQNRGSERIVIGDDGSVWYTNDHSFIPNLREDS